MINSAPKRSVISTGTTTIVLIFVLLCLLTFSVLSLVSARANMKMSQKSADHTTAFYQAENTANTILNNVIHCVEEHKNMTDSSAFYAQVRSQLEGSDGITFSSENVLTWQVPIKENQFLNVTISFSLKPLSNRNHYQIITWNTSNSYEWGEDQTIPLPQKDTFPDISTEE